MGKVKKSEQSITFTPNSLTYCELTEVMLNFKASPSITKVKQLVLLYQPLP